MPVPAIHDCLFGPHAPRSLGQVPGGDSVTPSRSLSALCPLPWHAPISSGTTRPCST